jgi:hypothetical protein
MQFNKFNTPRITARNYKKSCDMVQFGWKEMAVAEFVILHMRRKYRQRKANLPDMRCAKRSENTTRNPKHLFSSMLRKQ